MRLSGLTRNEKQEELRGIAAAAGSVEQLCKRLGLGRRAAKNLLRRAQGKKKKRGGGRLGVLVAVPFLQRRNNRSCVS